MAEKKDIPGVIAPPALFGALEPLFPRAS